MSLFAFASCRVEAVVVGLGGDTDEGVGLVVGGRSVVHEVGDGPAVVPAATVHRVDWRCRTSAALIVCLRS